MIMHFYQTNEPLEDSDYEAVNQRPIGVIDIGSCMDLPVVGLCQDVLHRVC